jgi:hypothetical protein
MLSSIRLKWDQENILKMAFIVGAVTDGLAVLPMLIQPLAKVLWGFDDISTPYRFAMGYSASLMLGWTTLLIWAYKKPLERKAVAAFTVLVVYGFIVAEVFAVFSGQLEVWRMVPTWVLQAVLLSLFAGGFHFEQLKDLKRNHECCG